MASADEFAIGAVKGAVGAADRLRHASASVLQPFGVLTTQSAEVASQSGKPCAIVRWMPN